MAGVREERGRGTDTPPTVRRGTVGRPAEVSRLIFDNSVRLAEWALRGYLGRGKKMARPEL